MKKLILPVVAAALSAAYAEERTVSTAADLVQALTELNASADADKTVYLSAAEYDVGAYDMDAGKAHLKSSNVRLVGKGAAARDVVVFGNGSRRVLSLVDGGVENLVISNGVCSTAAQGSGGGVNATAGSEMSNVVVTCCSAVSNGGGATLGTWRDSTFEGNSSAGNGGAVLGGVYFGCLFTNNTATVGGAVYSGARLNQCRVLGNRSTSNGGGAAGAGKNDGDICHIVGGEIGGNEAGGNGGGVFNLIMEGGVCVHDNTAAGNGGGVYNDSNRSAKFWTTNAVIHSNTSGKYGGGAYLRETSLYMCVVSNNFAHSADGTDTYGLGGGVYAWDASVDCSKVVFNRVANENTASGARTWGGGIYSGSASNTLIAGNAIIECKTTTRYGAAAYNCALKDCVVVGNYCYGTTYGTGGSTVEAGSIERCVITNNISTYEVRSVPRIYGSVIGGSAYACNAVNTTFSGYQVWADMPKGVNVYTNGLFYRNTNLFDSNCCLTNCLVVGNYAGMICCAKVSNNPAVHRYINCTFTENAYSHSGSLAGGNAASTIEFENCIFSENYKTNATANVRSRMDFSFEANKTNVSLQNCLMGTESTPRALAFDHEENTVTNDYVRFMRTPKDPYALKNNSPARDKGIVRDWMADATDIRGDSEYPRLRDGKVDLGCYQCWLPAMGLMFMFH